jgi:hypothetical protein
MPSRTAPKKTSKGQSIDIDAASRCGSHTSPSRQDLIPCPENEIERSTIRAFSIRVAHARRRGGWLSPPSRGGDRYRISAARAQRRATFAVVKLRSRLFTALNLLPSLATLTAGEKVHSAAELDQAGAPLANGAAIVLPEISDRLVIGDEAAKEPHHLDVEASPASSRVTLIEPRVSLARRIVPYARSRT